MIPLFIISMLTLAATGCLAIGQEPHFTAWLGRRTARLHRTDFRAMGWFLLASAAAAAIRHWCAGTGLIIWIGLLCFAILAVAISSAVCRT